jgi:C-terminal processing protease CtpA/Prc
MSVMTGFFFRNHVRTLAALVFALLSFVLAHWVSRWSILRDAGSFVCGTVRTKYFDPQRSEAWVPVCRQAVRDLRFFDSEKTAVAKIQHALDALQTSHLQLYSPEEDASLWRGENLDSGVRVRMFASGAIVSEVLPKSPAEELGVRKGDRLIAIDRRLVRSSHQAEIGSGDFEIHRGNQVLHIFVQPRVVITDESPVAISLNPTTALLRLPSFRKEFFETSDWLNLEPLWIDKPHLIIDLRGNSGGNFVSMLRAVSPFFCHPTIIGRLENLRFSDAAVTLPDELDDEVQIDFTSHHSIVDLQTFDDYGCYGGQVVLLTDGETASTSEIFASALHELRKVPIYGAATAGDVVMAIWYSLPLFPSNYSMSVPTAIYKTTQREVLEGQGLWPDQELYYVEDEALRGQDSWILWVLRNRFR